MKIACCCLFFSICTCPGLLQADQITLKNGDVITGAIIKKDGGKLTIKSEFLGEVTMPWDAVVAIKSDAPVTVALPGGHDATGKITTQGNQIRVETAAAAETAPLAEISTIRDTAEQRKYERLLKPGWYDYGRGISIWASHWLGATRERRR